MTQDKVITLAEIAARAQAVTPDLVFWRSLGGQLCCDWPRRIWDNPAQCQRDIAFHNHAHTDMLVLLSLLMPAGETDMPRIPSTDELRDQALDGEFYKQAVEEINQHLPDALSIQGYGACTIDGDTPLVVIDQLQASYALKRWKLIFTHAGRAGYKVEIFQGDRS